MLRSMQSGGGKSLGGTASASGLMGETPTSSSSLPPGIYASESAIEIDVSLVPRPDQAIAMAPDLMSGTLTDLPTDIKTVAYFIQPVGPNGVQDPLSGLAALAAGGGSGGIAGVAAAGSGGLVRRSLARAVVQKSYNDGTTDQLSRTGELISTEVVGLAMEFYDGTQWLASWDASTQKLPLVVRVSIALQDPSVPLEQRIPPPISLQTMAPTSLAASGIQVYSTLVPIAGAALTAGTAQTASGSTAGSGSAGAAMSGMGL